VSAPTWSRPIFLRGRGWLRRLVSAAVLLSLACLSGSAWALSYTEEKELGREVFNYVKRNMKIVNDPIVANYINDLGRKILKATGPQPFDYQFFVIDSEVANAFAAPAGYVFIHSGLITLMESEGQLAAIISHEIAHVTSRHLSERLAKTQKLSWATLGGILAGAFLGGAVGQAMMMGTMAGNIQMQLAYSRHDEREADVKGLTYLVESGYDPRFMTEAFQIMLRTAWSAPKDVPTYLTTHPGLPERISSVETAAASNQEYGGVRGRGDERAFQAIKARLLALVGDAQRARNHFESLLRQDPDDALGHYGLAVLYQQQQNFNQSLSEFNLALKTQPANPTILTDLGHLLFQKKDFAQATEVLNKVVVIRPHSVQALFLLGRLYEEQGQPERAEEFYQRVLFLDSDHEEALYKMGLIYGRQGDLARAHLHLGLSFKVRGEYKKALFHLRKAKENDASAPLRVQEQIEKAFKEIETEEQKKKPDF